MREIDCEALAENYSVFVYEADLNNYAYNSIGDSPVEARLTENGFHYKVYGLDIEGHVEDERELAFYAGFFKTLLEGVRFK